MAPAYLSGPYLLPPPLPTGGSRVHPLPYLPYLGTATNRQTVPPPLASDADPAHYSRRVAASVQIGSANDVANLIQLRADWNLTTTWPGTCNGSSCAWKGITWDVSGLVVVQMYRQVDAVRVNLIHPTSSNVYGFMINTAVGPSAPFKKSYPRFAFH